MARYYVGEIKQFELTVADSDGVAFDPDSVVITAVDPAGEEIAHSTDDDPQTIFNPSVGVYVTHFEFTSAGPWKIILQISYTDQYAEATLDIEKQDLTVYDSP